MKHFFQQTTEEVLSNLGTTTDGLNDAKVEEQRAAYGRNELEEKKSKNVFQAIFNAIFGFAGHYLNCGGNYLVGDRKL